MFTYHKSYLLKPQQYKFTIESECNCNHMCNCNTLLNYLSTITWKYKIQDFMDNDIYHKSYYDYDDEETAIQSYKKKKLDFRWIGIAKKFYKWKPGQSLQLNYKINSDCGINLFKPDATTILNNHFADFTIDEKGYLWRGYYCYVPKSTQLKILINCRYNDNIKKKEKKNKSLKN